MRRLLAICKQLKIPHMRFWKLEGYDHYDSWILSAILNLISFPSQLTYFVCFNQEKCSIELDLPTTTWSQRLGMPNLQFLLCFYSRTLWKKCCFSGDGEYIVAGSARQHSLSIWEKAVGNLVKILHGTKGELLQDVVVRIWEAFSVTKSHVLFHVS